MEGGASEGKPLPHAMQILRLQARSQLLPLAGWPSENKGPFA